jgi:hypothetical protein
MNIRCFRVSRWTDPSLNITLLRHSRLIAVFVSRNSEIYISKSCIIFFVRTNKTMTSPFEALRDHVSDRTLRKVISMLPLRIILEESYADDTYSTMTHDLTRNRFFSKEISYQSSQGAVTVLEVGPGAHATLTKMVLSNPHTSVYAIEAVRSSVVSSLWREISVLAWACW